jgi:uncharacterized Fe-S cluster protein YjdI/CDGSH-type Zn-finger protein
MPEPTVKQYAGEAITVSYDAKRCIHFAECVKGLPAVFDTSKRPWIQVDEADADAVAAVVERCPSGALQYVRADGRAERRGEVAIDLLSNGPLVVRGAFTIDGQPDTRASLCRCGRTANQPYCDHECERSGWTSS